MRRERAGLTRAERSTRLNATGRVASEKWLLPLIFAATLFFVFVTPPFQAPDENQHYMKALALSEGTLLARQRGAMIGADLPHAAHAIHAVDFPTEGPKVVRRFDQEALARSAAADERRPGRRFGDFPNVASYSPTLYAAGSAGILLGRWAGLPWIHAFYAARVVNALTGLALLAIALWLLPFGRNAMLGVALLPTFAYQTGSLSPDAIINGLGFLGLSLALRAGFGGTTRGLSAALIVTGPLLALCKGVYLPLLAGGLRWPSARVDGRLLILGAAMAIGAIAFVMWMQMSGGSQALYHIQSRKTGETMMTAPLRDQLAIVIADPAGFARILADSVQERAPVYSLQIVGRFGWNAILMPLLAYPLCVLMLGASILTGAGVRVGIGQRLWWLAVAAGVALLIETAMYLTGTPLGADYIQGTQGRYFLPILPLVLLALSPEAGWRGAARLRALSAALLMLIAAFTIFDSFWVRGFITREGMPPHGSVARTLVLPSPRW